MFHDVATIRLNKTQLTIKNVSNMNGFPVVIRNIIRPYKIFKENNCKIGIK